MNNHLPPKFLIISIVVISVFCSMGFVFAQEAKTGSLPQDVSEVKQEQAQKYREMGFECQRMGDLTGALSFYEKAVAIYPNFSVAYNDLGIVYEALGSLDQAEQSYLKSIKIDPDYASVYTNLALLYENKRDLEKAAFYWGKRVAAGFPDDPWTQKAAKRLSDIRVSLSGRPFSDAREEDVLSLMREVSIDKAELTKGDQDLAQAHFKKAKQSFDKLDMATAIKEALDAQYLDQDNPEIREFIEKAERRALSR